VSVCVVLLLLALQGAPSSRAPSAPADLPFPPTRMGLELLSQQPVVAEVETVKVTPFGIGTAVVRMKVLTPLHPDVQAEGREFTVFAYEGHFAEGSQDLVYLLPFRRGGRWRVLQRVDSRDADYRAKLAMTRATIALLAEHDAQRQAESTYRLLANSLRSRDGWTRRYALSELRFMAARRNDLFTAERRAALATLGEASPYPEVGAGVVTVTAIAESASRSVPSRAPQESPPP